jgi:hypothetical protein
MPLDSSREYFCLIEGTGTRKPAFDETSWSRLRRDESWSRLRHHPISTGFDQPLLLIDTEFDELTDTTAAPGRFFGQLGLRFVFKSVTPMTMSRSCPRSDYYVATYALGKRLPDDNRDIGLLFLRRRMADFGGDHRLAWHIGRVQQQEYEAEGSRTWGCCLRCDDTAEDPRDITGPWQMFNPHTGASSDISMMLLSDAEDAAQCDTPLQQQQRQRWQERNRRPSTFWEVQNEPLRRQEEQLRRQEEQLRRQEETVRVGWRLRSAGRPLIGWLLGASANVPVPV